MNRIDVETSFTIIFVEIDDCYQLKGRQWLRGKVGRPAKFSDSEVMTLMLASEFLPCPSESQYLSYYPRKSLCLVPQTLERKSIQSPRAWFVLSSRKDAPGLAAGIGSSANGDLPDRYQTLASLGL